MRSSCHDMTKRLKVCNPDIYYISFHAHFKGINSWYIKLSNQYHAITPYCFVIQYTFLPFPISAKLVSQLYKLSIPSHHKLDIPFLHKLDIPFLHITNWTFTQLSIPSHHKLDIHRIVHSFTSQTGHSQNCSFLHITNWTFTQLFISLTNNIFPPMAKQIQYFQFQSNMKNTSYKK